MADEEKLHHDMASCRGSVRTLLFRRDKGNEDPHLDCTHTNMLMQTFVVEDTLKDLHSLGRKSDKI
tara:strand:+ start:441 stop:638 length:198 start_codon:yes stop_codon:yes gene_type:complete